MSKMKNAFDGNGGSSGGRLSDDTDDIPDDFFDELASAQFIDEIFHHGDENCAESAIDAENDGSRENSPRMARCLAEIDVLTKDIERRKKKLEKELTNKGMTEDQLRARSKREVNESPRSESSSRRDYRRARDRDRRKSRSRSRSVSPKRSRSPNRYRGSGAARYAARTDDRSRRPFHRNQRSKSPLPMNRHNNQNQRSSLRRSKSRSPRVKRSSSTHRTLTFLEELAQTFAEKGQAFPEKDLLMQQNANGSNTVPTIINEPPVAMDFGNQVPLPYHQQPMLINPVGGGGGFAPPMNYPMQPNMYYGMNPMSILPGNAVQVAQLEMAPSIAQFPHRNVQPSVINPNAITHPPQGLGEVTLEKNENALIDRCEHAIKCIRAKENNVPKLKFMFHRTSMAMPITADSNSKSIKNRSPLHSADTNIELKLNTAKSNAAITATNTLEMPVKMLPKSVKEVVTALGIKNSFLFEKMRTKEISAQISNELIASKKENENTAKPSQIHGNIRKNSEKQLLPGATASTVATANATKSTSVSQNKQKPTAKPNEVKATPAVKVSTAGSQTTQHGCDTCLQRNRRVLVNKHTQVFNKGISIGIQTNERDYREPIVEQLAQMTAAQLVAIKDFANIIVEPRPQNSVEMFKVRERMMDIYNLSQRDADAVRTAEENRLDDVQYIDQLRFRSGDSSSRDFDRGNSPMFASNGGGSSGSFSINFEANNFANERRLLEEREHQQRLLEERERERKQRLLEERERQQMLDDQREHERQLEEQREREREQIEQMRYEQRRRQEELEQMEIDRNRRQMEERLIQEREEQEHLLQEEHRRRQREMELVEQERLRVAFQKQQQQQQQQQMRLEQEMRSFNREQDERDQNRQNMFSSLMNRGPGNRRGRGAFRENNNRGSGGGRGRGNRRLI